MTLDEIKWKLESVLTKKRFLHSLGVMKTAEELAQKYGEDKEKAAVAGLLHDCARDIKGELVFEQCERYNINVDNIARVQPELLHGPLGAEIIRLEYGIKDEYLLRAVRYHTTGCENMSLLDKIVFVADCIEPNRNYPGLEELRKAALIGLDSAVLLALDKTIKFVLGKGTLIHPDTINARNFIILDNSKVNGIYKKKREK